MKLPDGASRLFSGLLSDVLDSIGVYGQVSASPFRLVNPAQTVMGFAHTARAVSVSEAPDEPYAQLLAAIDGLGQADVLVVSTPSNSVSALFGGLLATAVGQSGGAGVIVDGYIRDTDEIIQLGLPTASRGTSPLDSFGRDEVVEIGASVAISGVLVNQGDFVLCDVDGFVVVPSRELDRVVSLALEKLDREQDMRDALRQGMSVGTAFREFGVL